MVSINTFLLRRTRSPYHRGPRRWGCDLGDASSQLRPNAPSDGPQQRYVSTTSSGLFHLCVQRKLLDYW